jgi:hypothetical protein
MASPLACGAPQGSSPEAERGSTPSAHPAQAHTFAGREALAVAGIGALQGGLLYGAVISLLHAAHNRLGAIDGLVLLGWSVLLYGLGGAFAGGAASLALTVLGRLRGRHRRGVVLGVSRDRWLALGAFHVGFWVLVVCYGLTYDQSPRWVAAAPAMLAWLVLLGAGTALLALAAGWGLLRVGQAMWRRLRLGSVVALALLAAVAHVSLAFARPAPSATVPPPPPASARATVAGVPVAVVGVDGADWRVALPMVRAGELPHLARLMREGSWGPLATFPDSNSAVIWASIYSGREPADHGVLDFYTLRLAGMDARAGVYPVHRTFFKELALRLQPLGLGALTPIDRGDVAVPLLWEVAHARGRSIGVVDGYFYSYPAPVLADPASWFVAYGADGWWQPQQRLGAPPSALAAAPYATPPVLIAELGDLLDRPDFAWQSAALLRLLARRGQPDLVNLYTHEPDTLQHESWHLHEPRRYFGVDARATAEDPVRAFYRDLDRFLGELRSRLSPETVVVVVSDHGHSPTLFHEMDTQHRHGPPGMLVMHGPAIAAGELAGAGVLDLYPTLLHLLGLPVPADADGAVLEAALAQGFRAAHPVRAVASWDGLPLPRLAAPAGDDARSRDELEKLRNLGYIR